MGELRVLVATSTLAWGINMPARRVVVLGVNRGLDSFVSPIDIVQMCGRAGRTGLDERGDAYVLLPHTEFEDLRGVYQTVPPIKSHMGEDEPLVFQAITEMDSGGVRNADGLVRWHARSLAAQQGGTMPLERAEEIIAMLLRCHAIKEDTIGYRVTSLGRIASWLYFDPRNIWAWACNMLKLQDEGLWESDVAVAWAMGNVPMGTLPYISKEMQGPVETFLFAMNKERRMKGLPPITSGRGMVESWAYWAAMSNFDVGKGSPGLYVRQVRNDVERVADALKLIDGMWSRNGKESLWETMPLRVKYGVGRELVPLVELPGVGGVRARKLWDAGFRSLPDIADPNRARLLAVTVGANVAATIRAEAAQRLREEGAGGGRASGSVASGNRG